MTFVKNLTKVQIFFIYQNYRVKKIDTRKNIFGLNLWEIVGKKMRDYYVIYT